jgi:branched-chain amino acid transport system permease protein
MSLLLQLTINGIIAGSIYALVASGFSLIYGTNKMMHFAHGVVVVGGGYALYSLFEVFGINFFISILLTLLFSSLFGLLIYRSVYLSLQKRNASNVILLVGSIAVLIFFENLIQLIFGADVKSVNLIDIGEGIGFFSAKITSLQIVIVLTSVGLFFLLNFFMKKTKLGKAMSAVSENKDLASIWGINSKRIADYSFLIGSFLAGVGGILIGLEQSLIPTSGTFLIIKGFTGAVVGGIGSVPASIAGSYLLGIAENYGVGFLPSAFKDAIGFIILFLFLLFKPEGLFGIRRGVKDI